jgi:hypothetical protein
MYEEFVFPFLKTQFQYEEFVFPFLKTQVQYFRQMYGPVHKHLFNIFLKEAYSEDYLMTLEVIER